MRSVSLAGLLAALALGPIGCDCFEDDFGDADFAGQAADLQATSYDLTFPPGSDLRGVTFDLTPVAFDLAPGAVDLTGWDGTPIPRGCGTICSPNCFEVCMGVDTCTHFCPTGCPDCQFSCSSAGACNVTCDVNSVCTTQSKGTGKTQTTCRAGSSCELNCDALGDCIMNCTAQSACLMRCKNTASCTMNGCSAPLTCANGIIVCNRPCP